MDIICFDYLGKKQYYFSPTTVEDFKNVSEIEKIVFQEFSGSLTSNDKTGIFQFADKNNELLFLMKYSNFSKNGRLVLVNSIIDKRDNNEV